MRHLPILALLAISLLAGTARADILVVTGGQRLEGRMDELPAATDKIAFTTSNGRIELSKARVKEIIEEADAVDWTHIGRQFLKGKNFTAALQHFQKALAADPNHLPAKEGLKSAADAIGAEQSERAKAGQETLGKDLERVPELLRLEKYADALITVQKGLSETATESQRTVAQKLMLELYSKWAYSRFDRLDYKGAEEKYVRVLELDPNNDEARDQLLKIWRDDKDRKPEVLKAYQAKLVEDPNNLEINRIVSEMLIETQRYEEAIAPLRVVNASSRFANQGYDRRLLNAYKQTTLALSEKRDYENSIKVFREMLEVFPSEDQTQLIVMQYEQEKSKLAEDDWDGRALLVRKLRETQLLTFASRELELILRYDPKNQIVDGMLLEEAKADLARVQENFARKDYFVARDQAESFVSRNKRYPDITKQAVEIYNKADIEAKRSAVETRESARQIAETGNSYYDSAVANVDRLADTGRSNSFTGSSPKQDAIRDSKRAIEAYQTALRLDPTLGPISGMDLNARLADAKALFGRLTDRPTPLPNRRTFTK